VPRIHLAIAFSCAWIASSVAGSAWAQQAEKPTSASTNKRTEWLHQVYLRDASAYRFFLDDRAQLALELHREPVMRWTSENDYNGEVYVWTHEGVPGVVGCIFSGPQGNSTRHVMHEFHSLASAPLHAKDRGAAGWLAQEPGIKLEPIEGAPVPAASPARRLTQMRDLARRFTAQVHRDSKWEMRLLSQPIYRYEISTENSPVADGALFAFVWTAGTDPEVLLVIEARRTDKGVQWFYAPARFTNREAWLRHQGKEVWRADRATVGIFDGVTTKPYGAFQMQSIPDRRDE
jgi:hypothetical protein